MSTPSSGASFGEQLEAIGIVYGSSSSVLRFVETESGQQLGTVELTEYRSPKDSKEQFIGCDSTGQRVCFDIEYNSMGVEDVTILYGDDEMEFGIPKVVVLERGI